MTRQSGVYLDASYASQSPSGAGHYSWKPKLSDGGRLEIVQFIFFGQTLVSNGGGDPNGMKMHGSPN